MNIENTQDYDINKIPENELKFKIENSDFISLNYQGKEYNQIIFVRLFPQTNLYSYISIQDKDQKEIGIINDINMLDDSSKKIVTNELERRYFCYKILSILQMKDKMGYLYFDVILKSGKKSFAVKDISKNIKTIVKSSKIQLTDIDGNRFEIDDFEKLSKKEQKMLVAYLF